VPRFRFASPWASGGNFLRPTRAASCWTGQSLQCVWTLLGLPEAQALHLPVVRAGRAARARDRCRCRAPALDLLPPAPPRAVRTLRAGHRQAAVQIRDRPGGLPPLLATAVRHLPRLREIQSVRARQSIRCPDLRHLPWPSPADEDLRVVRSTEAAAIAAALSDGRRVQVGAEDARRTDAVLACVLEVAGRGLGGRLGATVQAKSVALTRRCRRPGRRRAYTSGWSRVPTWRHPVGTPTVRRPTSLSCAWGFRLAEQSATWSMTTHDGRLREALLLALGPTQVEQLLGVRPDVLDQLRGRGVAPGCTSPTAPTGFGTGCAASPSPAAPAPG